MRKRVVLAAFAILTLAMIVCAQEQVPALKTTPSASANKDAPPLALEIHYNSTLPPAYLKIEGPEVKPHWIWVSRFATLPGWQLPQGAQRINAVRVTSHWNGETAEVQVTLLRGVNFYDDEEAVTSYRTALDEQTVINKLESYGIEPFKITLISPKAVAPAPPNLENRTSSVEILNVQSESLPLAAYRVTFRNLSAKNLVALMLHDYRGERGGSIFFEGEDDRALISSNGTLTREISTSVPEKNGESYVPGAAAANLLIITSAVFTDGTFEGDVGPACRYERLVFGRKAWLKSALKIVDEQLNKPDEPQAAEQLKQKIDALRYARTRAESVMPSVVSPRCPPPAGLAERTFAAQNLNLIKDLETVTKTRPKPLVTFRAWLESTRQRYQEWLNNFEKFPAPRVATAQ